MRIYYKNSNRLFGMGLVYKTFFSESYVPNMKYDKLIYHKKHRLLPILKNIKP